MDNIRIDPNGGSQAIQTSKMGCDPGMIYRELSEELGECFYDRIEASASQGQKEKLKALSSAQINHTEMGGETIKSVITAAPRNHAPIDGVKVSTEHGWFAARPSGTEDMYKIYAESFLNKDHLSQIIKDAQEIANAALAGTEQTT